MILGDDNPLILSVEGVSKTYRSGGHDLTVLQPTSFALLPGMTAAITGPSGSGKTTLLGLCAGLDTPSAGEVWLCGKQLSRLSEDQRAALRATSVGFVFQNFQLLPSLTALENVLVPLELRGEAGAGAKAEAWLRRVGLAQRLDHHPHQLSGGEQQRVVLARAFAAEPQILFADEPTGNLDGANRDQVAEMLFGLNRDTGTTLVLVTHDPALAARADRRFGIRGGVLQEAGA